MEESTLLNSSAIMAAYHWLIAESSIGNAEFKKQNNMVFFSLGSTHLSLNFAISDVNNNIALLVRSNKNLDWVIGVPWSEISFHQASQKLFLIFYSAEFKNPVINKSSITFPSFSVEIQGGHELCKLLLNKTKISLGFFSVSDIIRKELISTYNLQAFNYG